MGKVGRALVELALRDGAEVVITDVVPAAVERVVAAHPSVRVVDDADALVRSPLDIYAPCALGGALSDEVADVLQAEIVCGGANNQLVHDRIDNRLAQRGITYCPDYVVNAGGVIQVADERNGFSFERAKAKAAKIYETTLAVLEMAATDGVTPTEAADRLAERRMSSVTGLDRIWVPQLAQRSSTSQSVEGRRARADRPGRRRARRWRGTRRGVRRRRGGGASRRAG